jgi:hypothetical protein
MPPVPLVPSGNFSRKHAKSRGNRLLGLLSRRDYRRLRPHLHGIPLEGGQLLYRARRPIEYVYFIETGICTLINTLAIGVMGKVGTIGNEGMVGLPVVWGDHSAPQSVPAVTARASAFIVSSPLTRVSACEKRWFSQPLAERHTQSQT